MQRLESHSFEPLKLLQWRNSDLDFSSIGALQASLSEVPTEPGLTRAPLAEDFLVLEHAARDEDIRALTKTRAAVERLWEACQVPDYRKIAPANHAELVTTLYGFLMREGKIPDDWFARQVAQADHPEGDIDSLSNGSRMFEPGHSLPTGKIGLPIQNIGRASHARSRTSCRMRSTSALPPASSIAVPAC